MFIPVDEHEAIEKVLDLVQRNPTLTLDETKTYDEDQVNLITSKMKKGQLLN